MSTVQLDITDGPTADRLVDSLKYTFTDGCKIPVEFRVKISHRMTNTTTVAITGLSYESGKPGAFNFTANIVSGGRGSIKGFYDAIRRSGTFERLS